MWAIKTINPPDNETIAVSRLKDFSSFGTDTLCISLNNQKKLLFTCIIPSDPAQIAAVVNVGSSVPLLISGATIEAVVIRETVIEPVTVVKSMLSRNGTIIPIEEIDSALENKELTMPVSFITCPKAPPVPVIKITMAVLEPALLKYEFNLVEKFCLPSNGNAKRIPISKDHIGFFINAIKAFSSVTIAPIDINTSGTNKAAKGSIFL